MQSDSFIIKKSIQKIKTIYKNIFSWKCTTLLIAALFKVEKFW